MNDEVEKAVEDAWPTLSKIVDDAVGQLYDMVLPTICAIKTANASNMFVLEDVPELAVTSSKTGDDKITVITGPLSATSHTIRGRRFEMKVDAHDLRAITAAVGEDRPLALAKCVCDAIVRSVVAGVQQETNEVAWDGLVAEATRLRAGTETKTVTLVMDPVKIADLNRDLERVQSLQPCQLLECQYVEGADQASGWMLVGPSDSVLHVALRPTLSWTRDPLAIVVTERSVLVEKQKIPIVGVRG